MTRKLPPRNFGQLRSRIARVTLDGELGFLTPVRAGLCGYHVFRCKCGTEVSRPARAVKRIAERGGVPKCSPKCTGALAAREVG